MGPTYLHVGKLCMLFLVAFFIHNQWVVGGKMCRWRTEMHVNQVQLLTGGKENSSIDANCSWQPGGLTPPTKTLGLVPPRIAPVIEMEIQEGVLQGEEMSHLTASQSVCSRYYCHFLPTLANVHSRHIFASFPAEFCKCPTSRRNSESNVIH